MPAKPVTFAPGSGPSSPDAAPSPDAPAAEIPAAVGAAINADAAEAAALRRIEEAEAAAAAAEAAAAARISAAAHIEAAHAAAAAAASKLIIPVPLDTTGQGPAGIILPPDFRTPDTSATRDKGKYWQHAGPTLGGLKVDVIDRYKVDRHTEDGTPYREEVVDLAYPGRDTPFVRQAPISDTPRDGHFVPA